MPGGHLATSVALAGAAYVATGSLEGAAGCFTGGFLIDFDHYLDYLLFEKQWRRPGPLSFLRYYFTFSPKKLVLPLHSAEFMTLLLVLIVIYPRPFLIGYWIGALMHLVFDILVNGDYALKRPVPFYCFVYRAKHRFSARELLVFPEVAEESRAPARDFFRWRPLNEPIPKDVKHKLL